MKFCKDCKWHEIYYHSLFPEYWCIHPLSQKTNLVTGEKISFGCKESRFDEELCGREGKFWEPKEK